MKFRVKIYLTYRIPKLIKIFNKKILGNPLINKNYNQKMTLLVLKIIIIIPNYYKKAF
jgi:hypothetical protein